MLNQPLTGLQQSSIGAAATQVENPLVTVATSLNMAIELSQRIERVAEHLIGPTDHNSGGGYPSAPGVLHQVQSHAVEAQIAIRTAHETLDRLESQI